MKRSTTAREALRTTNEEWTIAVVSGPNLSNLGNRHPERYGQGLTLADLNERMMRFGELLGVQVRTFDSNHEGDILEWLHENAAELDGILINPAGSTPHGFAIRNALQDTELPCLEVHLANPALYQLSSAFSEIVVGTVQGMRKHSYTAALIAMAAMLDDGDFERPPKHWPII